MTDTPSAALLSRRPLTLIGSVKTTLLSAFKRPALFLAILYAVAICFERVIETEIFKPYRLVGAALILMMILRGRVRLDRFGRFSAGFILLGFIVGLVNVILTSGSQVIMLITFLLWAFNLATYVALISLLRTRQEIALVAVVHALAMLFAAYGISNQGEDELVAAARQFGDFKNPANACVSMLFAAVVWITFARGINRPRRIFGKLMRLVMVVGVPLFMLYTATLTGSRAGAGLLLVGLLVYFAMTTKRSFTIGMVFVAMFLVLLMNIAPSRLGELGSQVTEGNILAVRIEKKGLDTDRLYLWRAGLDAFVDSYGVGLGMSRYQPVHKEYFAPYANRSDIRWMDSDLTLHNDYVSALVEFGVAGFLLFIGMCRLLVKMVSRITDKNVRAIAVAFLVGAAINGITHTGLAYFCVWFYFALISAWVFAERREVEAALVAAERAVP